MAVTEARHAIRECGPDLYVRIATRLQHAITGQPVFHSDSLVDLVKRHCPDLYAMAKKEGYRFVPSDDKEAFLKTPIDIRFDVIRIVEPN